MGCIVIKSYYHLNIQNTYAMPANIVPFLNIKYWKIFKNRGNFEYVLLKL